jgi:hypothetical protein
VVVGRRMRCHREVQQSRMGALVVALGHAVVDTALTFAVADHMAVPGKHQEGHQRKGSNMQRLEEALQVAKRRLAVATVLVVAVEVGRSIAMAAGPTTSEVASSTTVQAVLRTGVAVQQAMEHETAQTASHTPAASTQVSSDSPTSLASLVVLALLQLHRHQMYKQLESSLQNALYRLTESTSPSPRCS